MTRRTQFHKHLYLKQRAQDQNKCILFEEHKYKQLLESKGSLNHLLFRLLVLNTKQGAGHHIHHLQSKQRTRKIRLITASACCVPSTCQVLYPCHLILYSNIVFPTLQMEKLRLKEVTCPGSSNTFIPSTKFVIVLPHQTVAH